jgi:GDP-L-fucose synthase
MSQKSNFWADQRVVVTGGGGFLGSFVVEKLRQRGAAEVFVPRSKEYDLRDAAHIDRMLDTARPTLIMHLAAVCGGIEANRREPGRFFYDNAVMGVQLMEKARLAGVSKYLQVGTVCAYPKEPPHIPFREEDLWTGYPEETNAPYGLAKKMLLVQAQAYREQYGFNAIYIFPANLYGPRDNFDLESSHVIPAMIRKFVDAVEQGRSSVKLWGSGRPSREFLYVEDAAEGLILAAERYNEGAPCNLGTQEEITIRRLAEVIREVTGFKGSIEWDTSRPDGQPRRQLDVTRAKEAFGFVAAVPLSVGLQKTVDWYRQTLLSSQPRSR